MATISIRRCLALLSSMLAFPITGWAQDDPWATLVVQADSLGPETPRVLPTRRLACGPGVQRPDSIRVSGRDPEFLFATTSRRTRGYFQYLDVPEAGTGTFAVRELYCDDQGRPYTFVLERDHRYFFAIFSLREIFTYSGVRVRSGHGPWSCIRWDAESRRFDAESCPLAGGSKC